MSPCPCSSGVGRFRLCSRHPALPCGGALRALGFGGDAAEPPPADAGREEEKVTTWDFNGSWSRLSPWPRLPPPRGVALGKRTRVVWVGEKQPVWVARESRALGPTTKAASLDEAPVPVLVRKSAAHPGLGGARAAPTATDTTRSQKLSTSSGRFRLCSRHPTPTLPCGGALRALGLGGDAAEPPPADAGREKRRSRPGISTALGAACPPGCAFPPPYYAKTARSHAVRRRRMPVPSRFAAAATWMARWRSAVAL